MELSISISTYTISLVISDRNCVILKPSEYSASTSSVVKDIVEDTFSKEYVAVVQGSQEESEKLLLERFDYIFLQEVLMLVE